MGSWYQTCAITQLPIMNGEPMRAVFLRRHDVGWRKETSGYCGLTGAWMPISFPIQGQYSDDEGSMVDMTPSYKDRLLVEAIREDFIERTSTHNDPALTREGLDFPSLLAGVEAGRVAIQAFGTVPPVPNADPNADTQYGTVPTDIGLCFIREDIYRTLLSADKLKQEAPVSVAYKKALAWAAGLEKKRTEYVEIQARVGTDPDARDMSRFEIRLNIDSERSYGSFGHECDGLNYYGEHVVDLIVRQGRTVEGDQEVRDILWGIAEMRVLFSAMYDLRKMWSPQAGSGSQVQTSAIYTRVAKAMIKVVANRKKLCEG